MQPDLLEFWIDMNLPPIMVSWLVNDFNVSAKSFYDLGFAVADDSEVYKTAAKQSNSVIITTKDVDFINLSKEIGPPPKILYLNIGNISNKMLKQIIYKHFSEVIKMFVETDKYLIEISI